MLITQEKVFNTSFNPFLCFNIKMEQENQKLQQKIEQLEKAIKSYKNKVIELEAIIISYEIENEK